MTSGSAGGTVLPGRHDAGEPQLEIRRPIDEVLFAEQRIQPPLVRREGDQDLDRGHLLYQRCSVDGSLYAPAAIAGAGRRRGSGIRRRADNVDRTRHHLPTVTTAPTIADVTDDLPVAAVTIAAAVTAALPVTVGPVATVAVAAIIAAIADCAAPRHPPAAAAHGTAAEAGVDVDTTEDCQVLRHADGPALSRQGDAAAPIARRRRSGR